MVLFGPGLVPDFVLVPKPHFRWKTVKTSLGTGCSCQNHTFILEKHKAQRLCFMIFCSKGIMGLVLLLPRAIFIGKTQSATSCGLCCSIVKACFLLLPHAPTSFSYLGENTSATGCALGLSTVKDHGVCFRACSSRNHIFIGHTVEA